MVERLETNFQHRLQAAAEAIELLERAGFGIADADVEVEEVLEPEFEVDLTLTVGEHTRPLQALEDEDPADSPVFAQGFMLGLFMATMDGCGEDDCGYDPETGTCSKPDCPLGE